MENNNSQTSPRPKLGKFPMRRGSRVCSLQTPDRVNALNQNLIRPVLLFCQPFKGFIREQTGYKGINHLLEREHEHAAGRVLDFAALS